MKVTVIPIVFGAVVTVTKGLLKELEELEIRARVYTIQITALLWSARIPRRVQETLEDFMTKERTTLIQKDPSKGTAPTPKLKNHNLPTDDVETVNSTNKGRDLLPANKPRIIL